VSPLLIILLVYSAAMVAVGIWIGRSVRQSTDYFVGGRSLGAGLIFATFIAPNIGAGSIVAATGLAYQQGLAAWWWNGAAGIGSLILAFWIGPRMWREATRLKLLTVGDFLEHRFGLGVRGLAAIVIWCGSLFILCGQLDGIAAVLTIAGGVSHTTGCVIGAVVITGYSIAGGLASAARVNSIQLVVKLVGFGIATPLVIAAAGGVAHVTEASSLDFFNGVTGGQTAGWPLLFLFAPAFFLSPGLLQKAFGARDERSLTRGIAANGVVQMLFAFIPVGLGMAARVIDPTLKNTDVALTTLHAIPPIIAGLALAALFSAELSAGDAVIYMLSTTGARDIYRALIRPSVSDADMLRVARVIAVAGAMLGLVLTFWYQTVYDALTVFYGVMTVTLFAPILGGLLLPRGGRWAALAAMLVGVATYLAVYFATLHHAGFGWATPSFVGIVTSAATYLVLAIL
jgi:SSS family solute:Na+ symporter